MTPGASNTASEGGQNQTPIRGQNLTPIDTTSPKDFWRRWHITLSSWFRDYLYVPLGGNKTRAAGRFAQIATVFLVSGLWHGAALNFVAWGGLHGAGYLIAERWQAFVTPRVSSKGTSRAIGAKRGLQILATFTFVSFAWVFFRLSSFSEIFVTIERMIGLDRVVPYTLLSPVLTETGSVAAIVVLIVAVLLDSQRHSRRIVEWVPTTGREIAAELCFINWLVVTLVLMGDTGARDFVYFRF
jgi:alginate O-acetyltransferase complex protein AlgI